MDLETVKESILQKLKDAGFVGLTKSKLKITTKKSKQAFKELVDSNEIANIGSRTRQLFVLPDFFNPLERACDKIEELTGAPQNLEHIIPVNLSKLNMSLPAGNIRLKTDEAIAFLLKKKRLIKIKAGRSLYLLHVSTVESYLNIKNAGHDRVEQDSNDFKIDPEDVIQSYEKIKKEKGFSNIEIYTLQQELAIPIEKLTTLLLDELQKGRAVLSLGDWSLSSVETRSGAVILDGKPHLLVRFL